MELLLPATLEVDWIRAWKREAREPSPTTRFPARLKPSISIAADKVWASGMQITTNNGGSLRTDQGVDIGSVDGGGHYVGWIKPMEWLQFTTDIECGGMHTVRARVASQSTGGTFHLSRMVSI